MLATNILTDFSCTYAYMLNTNLQLTVDTDQYMLITKLHLTAQKSEVISLSFSLLL